MNVMKALLLALLSLPLLELVTFVLVSAAIGIGWTLLLLLASTVLGLYLLRRAGSGHIARMRVAMSQGGFTALAADRTGSRILMAGILLVIPGFITDLAALLLLLGPAWDLLTGRARTAGAPRTDGVVDLEPEQWRRVPEPSLDDRRDTGDQPPR